MAPLSKRASRIVTAGIIFHKHWRSPLSRAAGVPQSLLAMIASGEREPSVDVYRKVAEGLLRAADSSRKAAASRIEQYAQEMLAELED